MHKAQVLIPNPLLLCFQFFLKLGQSAVLQFRCLVKVIALLGVLDIPVNRLNLFPQAAETVHAGLLILPLGLPCRKIIVQFSQFLLQIGQAVLA